jgi:hypothetical protein
LTETHPRLRVVLAVGLVPTTVARVLKFIRPFGIGFTTGVEFWSDVEITGLGVP